MDDFFKAFLEALVPGVKVTVTFEKTETETTLKNTIMCPHCGWKKAYSRHDAAVRGWENHKTKCKAHKSGTFEPPKWLKDMTEGREL